MRNNLFFKPLAPLVLPTVYDDVLSYEEWLAKIVKQINTLTEYITDSLTTLDERVGTDVGELTAPLSDKLSDLEKALDGLKTSTDTDLNSAIETLQQEIKDTKKALETADALITELNKNYVDEKVAALESKTDTVIHQATTIINSRIDNIADEYYPNMYDVSDGYTELLSDVISHCYNSLRYFGIRAYQYDANELTADTYDGFGVSAGNYDREFLIRANNDLFTVSSPFTGEKTSLEKIVNQLVRYLQFNGKTADSLGDFTAEELDGTTLDAYGLDSNAYYVLETPDTRNKSYVASTLKFERENDETTVEIEKPSNYYGITVELANDKSTVITSELGTTVIESDDKSVNIIIGANSIIINDTDTIVNKVYLLTSAVDVIQL